MKYPWPLTEGTMPTIGALRLLGWPDPAGCSPTAGDGPVERGVAEAEDAAVGGDEPVPVAGWPMGVMPTTGRCSGVAPMEP